MNKKLKIGIGVAVAVIAIVCVFFAIRGCSKEETYTVTFNSNGGTTVSNQTVEKDGVVKEPSNPTRDGYTFGGWYIDLGRNEKYDFSQKVNKNITLTAKWDAVDADSFTVTLSGDGVLSSTKTIKKGEKLEKPADPTRTGYKFLGWYDGNKQFDFNTPITGNITLTAKWELETKTEEKPSQPTGGTTTKPKPTPEVKEYTVSFNSDGGTIVADKKVKENDTITLSVPTRSGYKFLGWYDGNTKVENSYKVTKNVTLVAKWEEIITYTVTFKTYDDTTPAGVIKLLRNGQVVSFSQLQDASGTRIGGYNATDNGMRNANKGQFDRVAKAVLTDGTVVNISK